MNHFFLNESLLLTFRLRRPTVRVALQRLERDGWITTNPIYLLILNRFKDIYLKMAQKYFLDPSHRKASRYYYEQFLESTLKGDIDQAERLTETMMETRLDLWKKKMTGGD